MTYSQHAMGSLSLSKTFFIGGFKGLIHAIYPDVLTTFAQDTMKQSADILNDSRKTNRSD